MPSPHFQIKRDSWQTWKYLGVEIKSVVYIVISQSLNDIMVLHWSKGKPEKVALHTISRKLILYLNNFVSFWLWYHSVSIKSCLGNFHWQALSVPILPLGIDLICSTPLFSLNSCWTQCWWFQSISLFWLAYEIYSMFLQI